MIDINILAKQNNLLIYDGFILVQPKNETDYITFPIDDISKCIRLTLEQYLGLRANYYKFNEKLTELVVRE